MNKNAFELRQFALENFRSFKNEQKIVFKDNKVAAVYGANASGKTNLTRALVFVFWFVQNSANADIAAIPYEPFKLNANTRNKPSTFTIEFGNSDEAFRYKFSLDGSEIKTEELFDLSSSRPKVIFSRTKNGLSTNAAKYGFGKQLFESTRKSSLIITKAQENNNEYAGKVFSMIQSIRILTVGDNNLKAWGSEIIKRNPQFKERILEYLREADLWIRDFVVDEIDVPEELIGALPFNDGEKNKLRANRFTTVKTRHAVRDDDGNIVDYAMLDMGAEESAGTNNFFDMIMPIIEALDRNLVLYIDEFGSSLHPDLAKLVIKIFKTSKKSGAQLIVNTHDTTLMGNDGVLDANEILFIEKNFAEESIITPLKDKDSFRSNDKGKLEKRYRSGIYGAVPHIKVESRE